MVAHKAAFDPGEVERLVILVVLIFSAEVFIPVAGHILLEKSYKVFEEFEAILSQFIADSQRAMINSIYFPTQKLAKIFPRTSSVEISPTMEPI